MKKKLFSDKELKMMAELRMRAIVDAFLYGEFRIATDGNMNISDAEIGQWLNQSSAVAVAKGYPDLQDPVKGNN